MTSAPVPSHPEPSASAGVSIAYSQHGPRAGGAPGAALLGSAAGDGQGDLGPLGAVLLVQVQQGLVLLGRPRVPAYGGVQVAPPPPHALRPKGELFRNAHSWLLWTWLSQCACSACCDRLHWSMVESRWRCHLFMQCPKLFAVTRPTACCERLLAVSVFVLRAESMKPA